MSRRRCCCNIECVWFTDDFSTDRLETDYTIQEGEWAVTGGVLTTPDTNAQIDVTPTPAAPPHIPYAVSVYVNGDVGDIIRIYLGDTSTYVELVIGNPTCTLTVTGTGGTQSIDWIYYSITGYLLNICVTDQSVTAHVNDATIDVGIHTTTTGLIVSLATGSTAENVTFDDLVISRSHNEYSQCSGCIPYCKGCLDGVISLEMGMTISGVDYGTYHSHSLPFDCNGYTCSEFVVDCNGTPTSWDDLVDATNDTFIGAYGYWVGSCGWGWVSDCIAGQAAVLGVGVWVRGPGEATGLECSPYTVPAGKWAVIGLVALTLTSFGCGLCVSRGYYLLLLDDPPDCTTFSSLDIPYWCMVDAETGCDGITAADFTNSSLHITSQ